MFSKATRLLPKPPSSSAAASDHSTSKKSKNHPTGSEDEQREVTDFGAEVVRLNNKGLTADACEDIFEALSLNQNLLELDLSGNDIGDDGTDALCRFLSSPAAVNLTALSVAKNGLNAWNCSRIAKACRKPTALQSLNLSGNEVGSAGLGEIGRLVQHSTSIRELVLTDTILPFESVVAFADQMLTNSSLMYLSLPFTLGFSVIEEIEKILQRNWVRSTRYDEQLHLATTLMQRLTLQQQMKQEKWIVGQQSGESLDARTKTASGNMREWSDPDTSPAMMYLSLLERKSRSESVISSVRSSDSMGGSVSSSARSLRQGGSGPVNGSSLSARAKETAVILPAIPQRPRKLIHR